MKFMKAFTLLCLAASVSTVTAGSPVGFGFGDGVSYTSEHSEIDGENRYEIGGPDQGFFFDPNAGAWEKHLLPPINGFIPGQIYCVQEWFTFYPPPTGFPNLKLADWHETIELGSDGLPWDIWTLEFGPPIISTDAGGPPISGLEFMLSEDRTELWFDFDPINIGPNGLTLHIEKYFQYTGSTVGFMPVIITQYPTPTPSGLALLAIGAITLGRRRRFTLQQ
jgi:hypothetical protein